MALPSHPGPESPRPTRLVYIPTNRPFEAALHSVVAEIEAARTVVTDDLQLLVVDDAPAEASRVNAAAVEQVRRAHGLAVLELTPVRWAKLVDDILAEAGLPGPVSEAARSALVKPTGSYGAGPNKAALVGAALGAVSLHRRDSDLLTDYDPETGSSALTVEIRLLDASVPGADACCVGSSFVGDPVRDRRDLEDVSPDLTQRLNSLSARTRITRTSGALPEDHPSNVAARRAVGYGVHVERDSVGSVEMGIAATQSVHEWIPEMPAVGIFGSDYFQKGLLYQLDVPVYYHGITAHHVYELWRAQQERPDHLASYAISELRYAVLRYHWNTFNEALMAQRTLLLEGGVLDSAAYGDLFVDALERGTAGASELPGEYVSIHRSAADAADDPDVQRRLRVRVEALEDAQNGVLEYVDGAIREFAALCRVWPALIATARAHSGLLGPW